MNRAAWNVLGAEQAQRAAGLRGAVLALAAAMAGCARDEAPPTAEARVDTLPSGTVIVTNPARGAWDPADAWRLEEDLRIGSAEGSGPDVFGEVRDIEVDATGRVYVLDHQAREIRVFDAAGRHVRSLGREGEGPGEFRAPTGMALGPDQRLWVADTRTARFTVFDTSGALAATYPRLAQSYGYAWDGGISRNGQLVDPTRISVGNERRQGLLLYDPAGSVPDTLPLPVVPEQSWELEGGSGGQRFLTFIQVPFTPTLAWRFDPSGAVWVANTARYALYRVSLRGDTTFGLIHDHQPVPVTAEDRERAIAGIVGSMQIPVGRLDPTRRVTFTPGSPTRMAVSWWT